MGPNYRIRPLPILKINVDMGNLTYRMNYGTKIWAGVYSWYIEGADQHILVDTAAEASFMRDAKGIPTKEILSFEDSLAGLGLKPDDINLVIQTHLHYDHCGHTMKCKNAKVVVQDDELKFALAPHPMMANLYVKPFLKGLRFVTVRGPCEIVPGIELIPAPGHTPGAQAVAISTTQGRAIITGFCSIKENFEPPEELREMWPVLTPGTMTNGMDAFDSALRIKGLADILIPQHDPSFVEVKSIP
jgi:glyoxylase-like metal-dependent hydrolase (beta-lactamase superfamily II)